MVSCVPGKAPSPRLRNEFVFLSQVCLLVMLPRFLTFGTEEFPVPVEISEEEAIDKSGFPQARFS